MRTESNAGGAMLERSVRSAAEEGRAALAAFLTAGYPSRKRFQEALVQVGAAADVLEVGVPFSDPMADGVTIQRSSRTALENGIGLDWILETLGHHDLDAPVVLMSYLNPLLAHGPERLAEAAASARVSGIIVPDLPLEEGTELRALLNRSGIALVPMVAPSTPPRRLEKICAAARGFVYAVALNGVTGAELSLDDVGEYLSRVRQASDVPVLAGFGIRERDQVTALHHHCDGVVVGTALIEVLERGDDPGKFLHRLLGTAEAESGVAS
jgi:tryptophan synthase alpha chain